MLTVVINVRSFLICNKCFKRDVGETLDSFPMRWNNYIGHARKSDRGSSVRRNIYTCSFMNPGTLVLLRMSVYFGEVANARVIGEKF